MRGDAIYIDNVCIGRASTKTCGRFSFKFTFKSCKIIWKSACQESFGSTHITCIFAGLIQQFEKKRMIMR